MNKTINRIIVDFMRFLGIRYCFGVPGSNMSLLDEINKSDIKLVLTKHEEGAAFMASGVSKSRGIPSSCFGSVGPGATNLVTAVAAAYHDSQPILVLSGQVDSHLQGKTSFQESTGIGRTINQLELFKNITKYAARLENKKDLIRILKEIYFSLKDWRPGPAYLEINTDVMEQKISFPDDFFNRLREINKRRLYSRLDVKKLKKIAKIISAAKKPVVLIGGGAVDSKIEIENFLKKTGLPVLTTLKGRGVISDDYSLSLGTIGITGQTAANSYLESESDLVMILEASLSQFTTKSWKLNLTNKKVIRFDVDKMHLTNNYKTDFLVIGDLSKNISLLTSFIKTKRRNFKKDVTSYRRKGYFFYPEVSNDSVPLKPQAFMFELRKYLPKNSIICSESIAWTQKYLKVYHPRTQIVCTGLAPIGCSLSEAIGARFANPKKIVVSIEGDGGFQMAAMELMTSANYHIPIVAIVLNNGVLGPIYNSQIKKYKTSFMTEFINPSFKKLSESFGIGYVRIEKINQVREAIFKALESIKKGSSIIMEVIIDKEGW